MKPTSPGLGSARKKTSPSASAKPPNAIAPLPSAETIASAKLNALDPDRLAACIEAAGGACRDSIRHRPAAERAPRGAAALTRRGELFSAPELAIVEGVGGSAEQLAVARAHLASRAPITHILVRGGRTGKSDGGPPTGATLQILLELAPRALIFWGTDQKPLGGALPLALLPGAFSSAHLTSVSSKPLQRRSGTTSPKGNGRRPK